MRQSKIELHKNTRIIILLVLCLLLASSFFNLYRVYREPSTVSKEVPVYSYQHQGKLDYQVQIKPNSVFTEKIMGPGESYYTNLVETIDAHCSYSYTADQPAKLTASYMVVAVVKEPEVWAKEFPLVPKTVVEGEGKEISFSRPFSFDLEKYEEFVSTVNRELGVYAKNPQVAIEARINVVAETADGQVRDELSPSMVIPLGMSEFKIDGTMVSQEKGALKNTVLVPNPGLRGKKAISTLLAGVLMLLSVLFLLRTESKRPVSVSEMDRAINKLWKQNGDRMVRVGKDFIMPAQLIPISLPSIEDLIKVADEACKPIIYQEIGPDHDVPACYVIDGLTVYQHMLQAPQLDDEVISAPSSSQIEFSES
ncbi:MAG: DUF5305 family protein [Thermacetogeniaceae bacterium]|nr:DUF5305 domain-containing protein [Syntrophomonadaceae bacterium]